MKDGYRYVRGMDEKIRIGSSCKVGNGREYYFKNGEMWVGMDGVPGWLSSLLDIVAGIGGRREVAVRRGRWKETTQRGGIAGKEGVIWKLYCVSQLCFRRGVALVVVNIYIPRLTPDYRVSNWRVYSSKFEYSSSNNRHILLAYALKLRIANGSLIPSSTNHPSFASVLTQYDPPHQPPPLLMLNSPQSPISNYPTHFRIQTSISGTTPRPLTLTSPPPSPSEIRNTNTP